MKSDDAAAHSTHAAGHLHGPDCGCGHHHHDEALSAKPPAEEQHSKKDHCCGGECGHHVQPQVIAAASEKKEGCCGGGCLHQHDHDHSTEHPATEAAVEKRFFGGLDLLTILLWGGVLVAFVANGRVVNFLTATGIFREQALVGGLGLVVLGVFNFAMRRRFPGCGHEHGHEEAHEHEGGCCGGEHHHDHAETCCDHNHGSEGHHHHESTWLGKVVSALILIIPLGLAAALAKDGYSDEFKRLSANSAAASAPSVSAVSNQMKSGQPTEASSAGDATNSRPPAFTLEDLKRYAPPTPEGNFPMAVPILWNVAGDPDVRPIIKGQPVETVGQVVKDTVSNGSGKRLRVFDLQVTCCAADARPVSFPIEFAESVPEYREMGWYKIVGNIDFEDERNGKITVLKVKSMEPTTRPKGTGPMY